jgi:peptidoglycan hydrolase CwlO-like protein
MPHDKNLQKKLHETRSKIMKLEMQIEDLFEERTKYQEKIDRINARISMLKQEIATLKRSF